MKTPTPNTTTLHDQGAVAEAVDLLRIFLADILAEGEADVPLALECAGVVLGLTRIDGRGLGSIARRHGCAESEVEDRCHAIAQSAGMPIPTFTPMPPDPPKLPPRPTNEHIATAYY